MTNNQRRQLAHLKRNWPDIGQQVAAEVGALDDRDEIQTVISQAIFKAAGWWGWMPNTTTMELDDIETFDPHYAGRYKKYAEYKQR
jgi:hypothetical protein